MPESITPVRPDDKSLQERVQEKRNELADLKTTYSRMSNELFSSRQEMMRMAQALKNQNKQIKSKTSRYVSDIVQAAKLEAELAYKNRVSAQSTPIVQHDTSQQDVEIYRQKLLQSLQEYRLHKKRSLSQRQEIYEQNQKAYQRCIDTAAYCKQVKAAVGQTIKKSMSAQDSVELSATATHQHLKNLNRSIGYIADRVMIARDEVVGFFKNQIQKMKREHRLAVEAGEELLRQRERAASEAGGAELHDMDTYIGDKDGRVTPRPPSTPLPSDVYRIGQTAKAKRAQRLQSASSYINMDSYAEDLLRCCELEGKRSKLAAQKQSLQTHVLYQCALLLLMKHDLAATKVSVTNTDSTAEVALRVSDVPTHRYVMPLNQRLHVGVAASASASGFTQSTQSYATTLLNEACQSDKALDKSVQKFTEALNSLCQLTEEEPSILPMPSVDASTEMSEVISPRSPTVPPPPSHSASPKLDIEYKSWGRILETTKNKHVGTKMQDQRMQEIENQKKRDKEREKLLKLHDKAKSTNDISSNSSVLKEWCSEEKFKSIIIDVMVDELGISSDIPMELALAKLSSMVTSSVGKNKGDSDSSGHQKQVFIEGLTTL